MLLKRTKNRTPKTEALIEPNINNLKCCILIFKAPDFHEREKYNEIFMRSILCTAQNKQYVNIKHKKKSHKLTPNQQISQTANSNLISKF